jgi:hypothetical protein
MRERTRGNFHQAPTFLENQMSGNITALQSELRRTQACRSPRRRAMKLSALVDSPAGRVRCDTQDDRAQPPRALRGNGAHPSFSGRGTPCCGVRPPSKVPHETVSETESADQDSADLSSGKSGTEEAAESLRLRVRVARSRPTAPTHGSPASARWDRLAAGEPDKLTGVFGLRHSLLPRAEDVRAA